MKKILYILAFFPFVLFAQGNVEFEKSNFPGNKDGLKEARRNLEAGDELFAQGKWAFPQALEFYLKAQSFNPNNAKLNYKIGVVYLNSGTKLKAGPYLEKAFQLDPMVEKDIRYQLGRIYHLSKEWDKAILEYKTYSSALNPKDNAEAIADCGKKINECLNGKELVKNPVRVFIDNLGGPVNSRFAEYSALISADESMMIFTSRRDNTTGAGKDLGDGDYFEDLYVSYKNGGKWSAPVNLGSPINKEDHDATAGLSADGQTLYIYKAGKNDGGDIYESKLEGLTWSKPDRLNDNINTKDHESSVCLSPDGNRLYFVSDAERDGAFGDRDIYYSTKDAKGRWGKAVNLGPVINTKYGEEGIFMHPDGKTLYFSSQGHKSMGGYDIFKTVYENGKWSAPENLGYPINSPDDDVFFAISASGRHGYYASFKSDGMGEKDIYLITFLGPEKPLAINTEDNLLASVAAPVKENVVAPPMEIRSAQLTILKGVITDALTTKPVEATIELVDNQRNEVIASFKSNSSTGKYLVSLPAGKNYGIAVKADNYLFHSENFDIPNTAAFQEVVKDVQLKNVAVGSKIVLKNIFFDFDKATLRSESTNELERLTKLLTDVPTLKIEISGHTDNKGSADYNQRLSESRAKSVVEYLIAKGISKDRLEFKGYGLAQPMATNDTEEGRQMNRRTEFKILSR